jgi:hypothetical protein
MTKPTGSHIEDIINKHDKEHQEQMKEQWNRLSAEKKKRVDISKIALDYYTDEKLGIYKIFKNKK